MENIQIIERVNLFSGESELHIQIDRGNGEFISMPKSVWDELEAAKK